MFGEEREYLTIKILHNDMTVMVPCENAGKAGLRRVIDEETVKKVLAVLADDVSEMPKNWNRRFKHNRDKIKTGDIYELAEVVRNLAIREQEKGLSTGEKQMFTRAKKILASELMYALEKDEDEAEAAPRRPPRWSPPRRAPPRPDAAARARWRSRSSWPPAVASALGPTGPRRSSCWAAARCSSGRSTRCAPAGDRAHRRRAAAGRRRPRPGRSASRGGGAALGVGRAPRCAAAGEADVVLVHDAARPLRRRPSSSRDCLAALGADGCDAAIAAAPVTDTVKEAGGDRRRRRARSTARACGRSRRRRPSAATRSSARWPPATTSLAGATDDAWLVEAAGGTCASSPAPRENLKVTTPARPARGRAAAAPPRAVS